MRRRHQFMLALAMALILSLVMGNWLLDKTNAADTVAVLQLVQDLEPGTAIAAEHLDSTRIPKSMLQDGHYRDEDDLIGQQVTTPLHAGEILLRPRLQQAFRGLEYPVPGPSRRLLTLEVTPKQGNGLWLAPGVRTDLYLLPDHPQETPDVLCLPDTLIVAVIGEHFKKPEQETSSQSALICIDVSQAQADELIPLLHRSTPYLSIVNEETP